MLLQLPRELQALLCSYLSGADVARLAKTCRRLRALASDDEARFSSLWPQRLASEFGILLPDGDARLASSARHLYGRVFSSRCEFSCFLMEDGCTSVVMYTGDEEVNLDLGVSWHRGAFCSGAVFQTLGEQPGAEWQSPALVRRRRCGTGARGISRAFSPAERVAVFVRSLPTSTFRLADSSGLIRISYSHLECSWYIYLKECWYGSFTSNAVTMT